MSVIWTINLLHTKPICKSNEIERNRMEVMIEENFELIEAKEKSIDTRIFFIHRVKMWSLVGQQEDCRHIIVYVSDWWDL